MVLSGIGAKTGRCLATGNSWSHSGARNSSVFKFVKLQKEALGIHYCSQFIESSSFYAFTQTLLTNWRGLFIWGVLGVGNWYHNQLTIFHLLCLFHLIFVLDLCPHCYTKIDHILLKYCLFLPYINLQRHLIESCFPFSLP